MSNDKKTLADVQPGGMVRLGDQAERPRFKAWWDAARPLEGSAFPYEIAWAAWQAALSAQPSPGITMNEDDFANMVECEAGEHGEMLEDGAPYSGWCFSCEELIDFSRGIINAWGKERYGSRDDLCGQLQKKCSDWGTYWRAPDAHGVILNEDQALELLRDALGVEVDFTPAQPSPGGQDARAQFEVWLAPSWSREGQTDSEGDFVYHEDWVQGAWVARQNLAARQPVGEPVGRVMTDFVHWHGNRPASGTDLYAAPAQAVDLVQFREIDELLSIWQNNFDSGMRPDDDQPDEQALWDRIATIRTLMIDSQAVGK